MKKFAAVVLGVMMVAGFAFAADMPDALMKGSWELGGGFWWNSASGDLYGDDGVTTMMLDPEIGYFIMDGLAIGIELGMENRTAGDATNSEFGFGPGIAYYLPMAMGPGHMYGELAYMMESKTENSGVAGADDQKHSYSHIVLGLGYDVMLSDHTAVFGEFYYDMASGKMTDPTETDAESGSNMGIMIGLKVFHF